MQLVSGKLRSLFRWWTALIEIGPRLGYFRELTKSWLITKLRMHLERTFIKYQSKNNKFWQKVSRVIYRYSHIQEAVCRWNSITVDLWNQSLESDYKDRTPQLVFQLVSQLVLTQGYSHTRLKKFRWRN